jgi:hypothetical protein
LGTEADIADDARAVGLGPICRVADAVGLSNRFGSKIDWVYRSRGVPGCLVVPLEQSVILKAALILLQRPMAKRCELFATLPEFYIASGHKLLGEPMRFFFTDANKIIAKDDVPIIV